jgi:hypothetical protein
MCELLRFGQELLNSATDPIQSMRVVYWARNLVMQPDAVYVVDRFLICN